MAPIWRLVIGSLVLLSVLAVPAGSASAQACSLDTADLRPLVDAVNQNVDQVPGFARGQFGGERIDVRIDAPGEDRRFTLTTAASGRITHFDEGAPADPTLRVAVSESTFCDVVTADHPSAAFTEAYYGGEIDVSGVGTVNAVKVEAVKIGASIRQTISGLFGLG